MKPVVQQVPQRAKTRHFVQNETIAVHLPSALYLELAFQLRKRGDTRQPDDLIAVALKAWLGQRGGTASAGYQWKELFLPDGTELRMRYRGVSYHAIIEGDQLKYAGESVSPRGWILMITGTVRNPWRDIWIRRGVDDGWSRAAMWRARSDDRPSAARTERRRHERRLSS
jgi:hypothetical protein